MVTAKQRHILIVDDEPDIRNLIAGILNDEGYVTHQAGSVEDARTVITDRVPDVMILDIWLKDKSQDGMGFLDEIHPQHPDLPIIMISGHGTIEMAVQAIRNGAYDFIEKPFKTERLLLMVSRAAETHKLRQENATLRRAVERNGARDIPDLVGHSAAIQSVRAVISKVAASSSRVLLTGEAGTGKETVARLIHQKSARATSPFVAFQPHAVKTAEQEDVLVNAFEQVGEGTLYIDEVADFSPDLQSRLLKILQDNAQVRLISATSHDLEVLIEKGRFKADLYYRLNVVPIALPSLRDRIIDVPDLFLSFLAQQLGRDVVPEGEAEKMLAPDCLTQLQSYQWPGNLREVRNCAEWVAIMHHDDLTFPLYARILPKVFNAKTKEDAGNDNTTNPDVLALPLRDARERFEQDYLRAQLLRFQGNVSQTAKFIGMERSALHRKMRFLNGEEPEE
ncbi:MAG: sigma-54 dependent transcriptional regulator [Pseudomonadota bacterium]